MYKAARSQVAGELHPHGLHSTECVRDIAFTSTLIRANEREHYRSVTRLVELQLVDLCDPKTTSGYNVLLATRGLYVLTSNK